MGILSRIFRADPATPDAWTRALPTTPAGGLMWDARLIALEPRFMFDAAGAVDALEEEGADKDDGQSDQGQSGQADGGKTGDPWAADQPDEQTQAILDSFARSTPADARREVAVIDAAVRDADAIRASLGPDVDVITLDANRDGLRQIADALAGRDDIDGLHIFSHGGDGLLYLGNTLLNDRSLDAHADALRTIGESLSSDGDILLYGCEVGRTETGQAFLNRLADITGADVAASDDDTGAADRGADWDLEITTGVVETAAIAAPDYDGQLETLVVTSANDEEVRDHDSNENGLFERVDDAVDGNGLSLREAIYWAEDGATILFDTSVGGAFQAGGEIDIGDGAGGAGFGELAIKKNLTIIGSALFDITIDGEGQTRHFHIYGDNNNGYGNLTLQDINLVNGFEASEAGGSIKALGTGLVLDNVTIENSQSGDTGGAVYFKSSAAGAFLEITGSYFSSNTAGINEGGALAIYANDQDITIERTEFYNNTANGNGGGLYADIHGSGSFQLSESTFYKNNAHIGGGVSIHFTDFDGVATIENSTFYQNSGTTKSKDIYLGLYGAGAPDIALDHLSISNDEITNNNRVLTLEHDGSIDVSNVSISDSFLYVEELPNAPAFVLGLVGGGDAGAGEISFSNVLSSYNASAYATAITNPSGFLGAFGHHGGPTRTLALQAGSEAIDAASGSGGSDQRGFRVIDGARDIGAFEYGGQATVNTIQDEIAEIGNTLLQDATDGSGLSLREALAHASVGETVYFHDLLQDQALSLTTDLVISQSVEIDGEDGIRIDAGGQNRHILHTGGDLSLIGLTLFNGLADQGGAIKSTGSAGSLTLDGLTISNNEATTGGGGGVSFSSSQAGATLTIRDTTLVANQAGQDGGGINAFLKDGQSLIIDNAIFANNEAGTSGGAAGSGGGLRVEGGTSPGTVSIVNGTFQDNEALLSGGAIDAENIALTIAGSTFLYNVAASPTLGTADASGGAVNFLATGTQALTITDSYFGSNENYSVFTNSDGGGAIYFGSSGGGAVTIARNEFFYNVSDGRGGGVYGSFGGGGVLSLSRNTFYSNGASGYGGGLALKLYNPGAATIDRSTLFNNVSGSGPTELYIYVGGSGVPDLSMDHLTIVNNQPGETAALLELVKGPNIGILSGILTNSILDTGGVGRALPLISGFVPAVGDQVLWDDGTAVTGLDIDAFGQHGGPTWVIPVLESSNAVDAATGTTGQDQRGYLVAGNGRDIGAYEYDGAVTVNTAADEAADGGSLQADADDGQGLSLREALFHIAAGETIGFDDLLAAETVTLTEQLEITKTVTIDGGGVITIDAQSGSRHFYHTDGDLSVQGLTLLNGLQSGDGGSILSVDGAGSLLLSAVTISGSQAAGSGGAVAFSTSRAGAGLTVRNSTLSSNQAGDAGGAVYVSDAYNGVLIENTTFSDNAAHDAPGNTGRGGALALGNSGGTADFETTIIGSSFAGNTAYTDGGAIDAMSAGALTLDATFFTGNIAGSGNMAAPGSAVAFGGAVSFVGDAASDVLTIGNNTQFVENDTEIDQGGGLFASLSGGARVEISDSTFRSNYAADDGGGVQVKLDGTGELAIRRTTFDNNIADGDGWGLSIVQDSAPADAGTVTVESSTFYNNSDTDGNGTQGEALHITRRNGGAPGDVILDHLTVVDAALVGAGKTLIGVEGGMSGISLTNSILDGEGTTATAALVSGFSYTASDNNLVAWDTPTDNTALTGLGTFGYHGGLTQTFSLLAGSNAIDSATGDEGSDQRNIATIGARRDVGAYEYELLDSNDLIVTATTDEAVGSSLVEDAADGAGLTLREALGHVASGGTISFSTQDFALDGEIQNNGTITLDGSLGTLVVATNNVTIDGDLNDDGIADVTVSGDAAGDGQASFSANDVRVFKVQSGLVSTLDGLVITGGYADAGDGGGLLADSGTNLTLLNTVLINNKAAGLGGGFAINGGFATLSTVSVTDNIAVDGGGGGFFDSGQMNLTDSTISGNRTLDSESEGGGLYFASNTATSLVSIANSTVSGNQTGVYGYGGGVFFGASGVNDTLTISRTTIHENLAGYGGGLKLRGIGLTATITESTISENDAEAEDGIGGGIDIYQATVTLNGSTVSGNDAEADGGGIFVDGDLTINNSTIAQNEADRSGGGLYITYDGDVTVRSSTIAGNVSEGLSEGQGGGLYSAGGALVLENALIANNTTAGVDDEMVLSGQSTITASYSLIETESSALETKIGSGSGTNVFVSDAGLDPAGLQDNGGLTQTIKLLSDSDAIDAGSDALLPADATDADADSNFNEDTPFDQRGTPYLRVVNGTPDIGAVEYQGLDLANLVVTTTVDDGINAGGLLADAADNGGLSLREALAYASPGGVITFDAAVFGQDADTGNNTTIRLDNALGTLFIDKTVTIEGDINDDEIADVTISGDGANDGVDIFSVGDLRVLTIEAGVTATLEGLVITGGFADELKGGGLYIASGATVTLSDSRVIANKAGDAGGGIYVDGGTLIIEETIISDNSAQTSGGGVGANNKATVQITGSEISGNTATTNGGGLSLVSTQATITRSTIADNQAGNRGGGIDLSGAGTSVTLMASTVSGNMASGQGGGIYAGGDLDVITSTVAQNMAGTNGGGLAVAPGRTIDILNSTIARNTATSDGGGLFLQDSIVTFVSSIIADNVSGVSGPDIHDVGAESDIAASYSLIERDFGLVDNDAGNNIFDVDPQLDPNGLADNGGPTLTLGLGSQSAAIDTGSGNDDDQRGAGIVRDVRDIGAVEFQGAVSVPVTPTVNTDPETLSSLLTSAAANAGAGDTLAVDLPSSGVLTLSDSLNFADKKLALKGSEGGSSTFRVTGSLTVQEAEISDGRLEIDGSLAGGSVFVRNGGILGGSGTITGGTMVEEDGAIGPGNSPGRLTIDGDLLFADDSEFIAEIAGLTAGANGYDQLVVTGAVTLDNPELILVFDFASFAGDSFTILNNVGNHTVTGQFRDLADGDVFAVEDRMLRINYTGGDGNDIVLTDVTGDGTGDGDADDGADSVMDAETGESSTGSGTGQEQNGDPLDTFASHSNNGDQQSDYFFGQPNANDGFYESGDFFEDGGDPFSQGDDDFLSGGGEQSGQQDLGGYIDGNGDEGLNGGFSFSGTDEGFGFTDGETNGDFTGGEGEGGQEADPTVQFFESQTPESIAELRSQLGLDGDGNGGGGETEGGFLLASFGTGGTDGNQGDGNQGDGAGDFGPTGPQGSPGGSSGSSDGANDSGDGYTGGSTGQGGNVSGNTSGLGDGFGGGQNGIGGGTDPFSNGFLNGISSLFGDNGMSDEQRETIERALQGDDEAIQIVRQNIQNATNFGKVPTRDMLDSVRALNLDGDSAAALMDVYYRALKAGRTDAFSGALGDIREGDLPNPFTAFAGVDLTDTSFLPPITKSHVALLIGVDDYSGNIPDLGTPLNDVNELGRTLEQSYGYQSIVLRNPGQTEIVQALATLSRQLDEGDSLVVFYAGHGYLMEDTGIGYWLPADAETTSAQNWLSTAHLSLFLREIPAGQTLLISDSCYSGAFTSQLEVTGDRSAEAGSPALAAKERAVLAMSSGGEEPVRDDGTGGHSVFAAQLLSSLRDGDPTRTGFQVFADVKDKVTLVTYQEPQYGAILAAGHQPGADYVFASQQ